MVGRTGERKWMIVVPWCLFGLLILRQYQYAMVYLKRHTYNDTILFLGSTGLIQLLQAALAILICLFAGKYISLTTGYRQRTCIGLMLVLYGLIGNSVLKDSVFQFPASLVSAGGLLLFFIAAYLAVCLGRKRESPLLRENGRWPRLIAFVTGIGFLIFSAPVGAAKGCLGEDQWMIAVVVTLSIGGASYLYFQKEFLLEISFLFATFFPLDSFLEIPDEIAETVRFIWILTYLVVICVYFYKRKYNIMIFLLFVSALSWIPLGRETALPRYFFGVVFALVCVAAVCLLDIAATLNERIEGQKWKKIGMRIGISLCVLLSCIVLWTNRPEVLNYSIIDGKWYEDEWMGESVTFFLVGGRDSHITLQFINITQIEDMDIVCTLNGEETIYRLSASGTESVDIVVPKGKNTMRLTASKTFQPSNGDERLLSVLFRMLEGQR